MTPNLTQYLGKSILVSIPALFDDCVCRACTLVGIEFQGLWLQSEELAEQLLHGVKHPYSDAEPAVFVPYAQIAGILIATAALPHPSFSHEGVTARSKKSQQAKKSPDAGKKKQ